MGGYDEEGDYTGSGEYDANMTYVGEAPQKKPWQKKETGRAVTGKTAAMTESVNMTVMAIT